jgi:catechol 2,3-dioxygenase-like lactoylglutathione lyase family enzyme/GNAT superfamily N-acetyltransferase
LETQLTGCGQQQEAAGIELARGSIADLPIVMGMFDAAVEWLVGIGRSDQWGSGGWSGNAARRDFVRQMIEGGELWLARIGGEPAGVMLLASDPMPYVPVADEPELYVKILLSAPEFRGRGAGAALLRRARHLAVSRRTSLLRVDCWAGGEQRLVRYYTGQGFVPTMLLDVRGQPVQVFEMRIGQEDAVDFGFGIDHVQLAIPAGTEDACRAFYVDVLGMRELEKPPELAKRGGIWVASGSLQLHLGVEADFRPARKAHPGILTAQLDALAARLTGAGIPIEWDDLLPGIRRFYAYDPNGNRLEFLSPE